MHIILGEPKEKFLSDKYTLLPLDKVRVAETNTIHTAYCVIDKDSIDFQDAIRLDEYQNLHIKLMENYYKKNWSYCEQAIEHLQGAWKGSVDTFYNEILDRVAKYREEDPGKDWDGIIDKS